MHPRAVKALIVANAYLETELEKLRAAVRAMRGGNRLRRPGRCRVIAAKFEVKWQCFLDRAKRQPGTINPWATVFLRLQPRRLGHPAQKPRFSRPRLPVVDTGDIYPNVS
jgi:hypothetical protein